MVDVCAERGWLATTLHTQQIMQMVIQARWVQDSSLLTLPHLEAHHMYLFMKKSRNLQTLPGLRSVSCQQYEALANVLRAELDEGEIEQVCHSCSMQYIVNSAFQISLGTNEFDEIEDSREWRTFKSEIMTWIIENYKKKKRKI
jgi:activating signal cointegrator complex subunit 3